MLRQIRFSGFGGQGIIRSGYISGKAASLFDGKFATMIQSFGPEARGSSCSAQLLISDTPVLYPYLTEADVLVAMSRESCEKYLSGLRDGGILLIDRDLVKTVPDSGRGIRIFSVPATRMAEELGKRIVANVVMLGFFAAITRTVSAEALRQALPGSVPERALGLNRQAFDRGFDCGVAELEPREGELQEAPG